MTAIETAARALVEWRNGSDDYDRLPAAARTALKNEVCVMLRAIRDPSEGITEAGAEIIRNVHEGQSEHAFQSDAANTWRFMIDAMLADDR